MTTRPRHPYTRQLLGAVPSMQAALAGQTAADLAASATTADESHLSAPDPDRSESDGSESGTSASSPT
ncbi:MAG TPA: hypothetical protein VJ978_01700 [Nitriliruptoraceae bacterium]|nr:hypothetical protein [Nitriliruptoraceae bacterium]